MDQKHILWPAIIIILLIAAGALYYAMNLSSKPTYQTTPTPPATTADELETADAQNAADLEVLNDVFADYNSVDTSQDNDLGI